MAGTYIIEDLHTSYWWRYQGRFRAKKSSIEYLKNFIDSLNVNAFKKPLLLNKKQYEELKYFQTLIKKISFYDAICSIEKYNQQLTEPFGRVVTGKNANVVPDVFINEFKVENNIDKLEKLKEIFE